MEFRAALAAMRRQHDLSVFQEPGGHRWACSCGKEGLLPANYPTERQARARGDRHLRAEFRKLLRPEVRS